MVTTKSNHVTQDMNVNELSIAFEEDDTSVNFYVKVEGLHKRHKPKKSAGLIAQKRRKIKPKLGKEKQDNVDKLQVKGNSATGKTEAVPTLFGRHWTELPPTKCPMGPFEAVVVNDLHDHMKDCTRTINFNCVDCPYISRDYSTFVKHRKHHSLKDAPYKCSLCTFGADSRNFIKIHVKIHLESKLQKKDIFQCPLCPFAESYSRTLNHFRLHAKENKHLKNIIECPLCGMKSKSSSFGKHTKHHIKIIKEECNGRTKYVKTWQSGRGQTSKEYWHESEDTNTETDDTKKVESI